MSKGTTKAGGVGRRDFLAAATVGAAAAGLSPKTAVAATPVAKSDATAPVVADPMAESRAPQEESPLTVGRSGSDVMVDILKTFKLDYVFSNPGSSFRGLQESVVNYGGNKAPEFITCLHEEASIAMAHGYAKVAYKPAAAFVHATVGVQHASMAVYNAYADRVPVYIVIGNTAPADRRRAAEWPHSAQDNAEILRDFLKWDDQPVNLQHFADSAARAYRLAVTAPAGPVALVVDSELQENPVSEQVAPRIARLVIPHAPQGDLGGVEEAARLLVAAEWPVIAADRLARTPAGMAALIELAELLQAPVIDELGRMNFPTRHPLNATFASGEVLSRADVILGLEVGDLWGLTNRLIDQVERTSFPRIKDGTKLITISARDLGLRSNMQEFGRFVDVDLVISGDGEATLPVLIDAVRRLLPPEKKDGLHQRGAKISAIHAASVKRSQDEATANWNSSPISTSRLCAELWQQIASEDWSFLSDTAGMGISFWPHRLWKMDRHYHSLGNWGAGGIGYGGGAAVGAALANREHGRLQIAIIGDGDLNYSPGILWTAAHHRVPLLLIVHNNGGYHQELMHLQRMALRHERGIDRAWIGTTLRDPAVDYAKLASGYGVHAQGPIADPARLAPAIRRAIEVVKGGQPSLLDIVSQPR